MSKRISLLFCGFILISVGAVRSQVPANTLEFDTSKVNVTVRMDRTEYLPGEVVQVTLQVLNPGSAALAPTPFIPETGCLYMSWKVGDEFKAPTETHCFGASTDDTNTTTFAAGERRQKVSNSYDMLSDLGFAVLNGAGGAPWRAGDYRQFYRYGTSQAMAEFKVVSPTLEAKAAVRINDVLFTDHPAEVKPEPLKYYVYVLALRADNQSYICVSQGAVVSANESLRDHDGTFSPLGAAPFKRIATSAAPVVSLSGVADADENLTIQYSDANGGRQTLYYPASYPARPAPQSYH